MLKNIFYFTIIFISITNSFAQSPAKFIAIDSNGNTFEIDPFNCTSIQLNRCASSDPFSIALINNMVYYTEGFNLFRYQFNTSGSCQFLGTFNYTGSSFLSSLTSGPDGMIYAAAGNTILRYNPTTNVFSNLGNIPSQWQSSGDLVFFEGQLLLSTINDKLVRIDLNNLSNSQVVLSFASNTNIFGLSTITPPCGNNQLFAINSTGGNTTLLPINLTTNTVGAAVCSFPFQIYDTASLAENGSSSNTIPTFTQVAPICSGAPLAVLPTTSLNNINGTWSPAINNTATTTYTFTPITGQCATTTSMTITVDNPSILHITKDDPNCNPNQLSWSTLNTLSNTTATTSLGSNNITISKPSGGLFTTPDVFSGGLFPTQYNLPINSTSIANDAAGVFTFCYDNPVVNPQIAIASIGNNSMPVTINTSVPYQVIWAGPGMTFTNNQSLIGVEGYCIIVFPGTHQCISFDYLNAESYCNIVFGSQDSNCQIDPICIGESVTLAAHGSTNITWAPTTNLTFLPNNKVIAAPTQTTTYTITSNDACQSQASITVTVLPNNTITPASTNTTLCIGSTLTNITHSTTGAIGIATTTTNYGLPTGVSASWNANIITISGTPTVSGTFNYIIPLTGGCGSINATGTITVTANNTVGPASSTPTLCIGTTLTNITHTTTGANGIAATTTNYGLPTGVSASWNANTITISGTPTVSGTFNYTIPLTGGCGSLSATGTITVTANNTVGPASSTPTLCIGTTLTNITHSTTGATGIATTTTNHGLPTGVSASWNANTITISGTPTVSGTFNYTIPLTGGCGSVSATGTITVTANNTVGPASSTPTLCLGTALTNITHSTTSATGIATTTTNHGLPTGVLASWNANTITISGTPTVSGTFNYTIPLTGGCGSVSATGTITVTANNTVGPASSTPTLCIGTTLTNITHTTTGANGIATTTTNYGLPTGVSASWNANTITISGAPTASGTFNYIIPLTGGCGSINATGTITIVNGILPIFAQVTPVCQGATINIPTSSTNTPPIVGVWNLISSTANDVTYEFTPNAGQCALTTTMTIVVHPLPIVTPSVTTQSFCSGGTTNINLVSNVPGSAFYWTATGTSVTGQSGSVTGSGATSINQTLTLNAGQVAAGQVTYTIVAEANGCLGAPVTVVVTVNPIPNVIVSPSSLAQTICSGGTTNISFTGAINNTVYTWSVVSSVGVSGALNGVGTSINQILTTTGLSQGTVVYEVTPSLNGCPGTPQRITVTVNPVPELFGSTSHRDLCSGRETTNILVSTFNAATVFNWVVEPNGVSGASAGTATGLSINIVQTLTTTGNVRGYVDYIITPVLTGCSGIPITVRVYVNPLPVVSLTDGTICVDAAGVPFQSYVLDSGLNDVDYDFVWTFEGNTIPGETSATHTATQVGTYTVVATNSTTNCVSNIASAVVTATNPATSLTVTQSEYFSDNATLVVTVTGGNETLLYQLDQGVLQESNVFTGVSAGLHTITVVDTQGCTYLTQEVLVIDYPKYFTPNGDGHNDTWNIIGLNQPDAKLYIFDRYGKLLKQIVPSSLSNGWDGTYNNVPMPSTDYWFTLDYKENGTQKQFKAHFSLKR